MDDQGGSAWPLAGTLQEAGLAAVLAAKEGSDGPECLPWHGQHLLGGRDSVDAVSKAATCSPSCASTEGPFK